MDTLQMVRDQIASRGAKTIRSLGRVFRHMDSFDGNRKLSHDDFRIGLQEIGCQLNGQQVNTLFKLFDTNGDGNVDFNEFLVAIRGSPSARRQAMIDKAFLKFDKDGFGTITSADLKGVYNVSMHPKVQKGEMSEEQVFIEFLQNFGDVNQDGVITRDEWNDYYAAVSASIDNDDHFVELMKICWKLD